MTPVDYILVGIVCISVLFGAIRGFLRESIALLGWLVGLWMAWRYASVVQPYLGGLLRDTPLQIWLARIVVLTAVVVCAWLLGSLLG
jgi:membrane protein required for colicin V production